MTVIQAKQPPFDERLVRRIRHLPDKQRDAMAALSRIRRRTPETMPHAAHVDSENSFETELAAKTFDLVAFVNDSWDWIQKSTERFKGIKGSQGHAAS